MEFLGHSPLDSKELQFVSWVMHLGLAYAPAGIGNDGISPIITGLVKDNSLTGSTSVSMWLEGPGEVSVGQDGAHCTQVF